MYHSTIQFSFDKLHSSLVTLHLFCVFYSVFLTIIFCCFKITHYCVAPEITHISPMEGTFFKIPPPRNGGGILSKNPYLEILIKFYTVPLLFFLVLQKPPPPQNSNPFCEGDGRHIVSDIFVFA